MNGDGSTRDRILTEAMRLFGEHGYQATRIAEIEAAVGLRPGSGGIYKHFRSKAELLAEGVDRQLASGSGLLEHLGDPAALAGLPLAEQMTLVVRAGFRRLDQERDLNRLIVRDLARFPELMDDVRRLEMRRIAVALGEWLSAQAGSGAAGRDFTARGTVLSGAVANYWMLRDAFGGEHPSGVTEEEFVAAAAYTAAALIERQGEAE